MMPVRPLSGASSPVTVRTLKSSHAKESSTDRWHGRAGGGLTPTRAPPSDPWPSLPHAASLAYVLPTSSGVRGPLSVSSSGVVLPRWLLPAVPNWALKTLRWCSRPQC